MRRTQNLLIDTKFLNGSHSILFQESNGGFQIELGGCQLQSGLQMEVWESPQVNVCSNASALPTRSHIGDVSSLDKWNIAWQIQNCSMCTCVEYSQLVCLW